jgi:hypothetical protein
MSFWKIFVGGKPTTEEFQEFLAHSRRVKSRLGLHFSGEAHFSRISSYWEEGVCTSAEMGGCEGYPVFFEDRGTY